jgi:two-component system C4-dicarboxylate transport response regulator DctD
VLLDLALPDMPGEVMLEHMRRADPALPVVMITGNTDAELARRTPAQGAFDYVEKPFSLTPRVTPTASTRKSTPTLP